MSLGPAGIRDELLLEFFLAFAKFEFALKHAGFFKRPRRIDPTDPPDAQPDWDCFASSIRLVLEDDADPSFRDACQYILAHPPDREVILNGSVVWEAKGLAPHLPLADRILICVRRVRNNLFHGAKHSRTHDSDPQRNERLLRCSLTVLTACLRASPSPEISAKGPPHD